MSYLINEQETERLTFPDGEWADLRKYLTQEATDRVTNALVEAGAKVTENRKPEASINLNLGKLTTLQEYIVGWSFTDDGKLLPVTRENINLLQPKYRNLIVTKINELTASADEFVTKNA